MGEAAYKASEDARRVFYIASEVSGLDMAEVCFGSQTNRLDDTLVAQQAITAISIADFEYLKSLSINFDVGLGHSLGEMALLAMAEILPVKETMQLTKARATATAKAAADRPGEMVVVSGLEKEELSERISHILANSRNIIANLNGLKQHALSGDSEPMQELIEHLRNLKLNERLRVSFRKLKTGGAFHNPYHMENAAAEFFEEAQRYRFNNAQFELMLNNANYLSEIGLEHLARYLSQQLISPVDFVGSANRLIGDKVYNFIEVGDKMKDANNKDANYKVLSGLLKKDFGNLVHIVEVNEAGSNTNGQKTA